MDIYTAQTREWLNSRFRYTTEDGIFFAHQNIYGFKSPYCEDGVILRYAIFSNVVKALSQLNFESILDVGGAEGYMVAAFREFFGVRVRACDLSDEACARAREIFSVEADVADGVALPYSDNAFDVVLSSESLEHIPRYDVALKELLRVAKKAVIVTVPHDGPEAVADNIRRKVPHAHLHDFTLDSFRDLVPSSYVLRAWGLWSSLLRLPFRLVEGRTIDVRTRNGFKRLLVMSLNPILTVSGRLFNRHTFKFLMKLDPFLSNELHTYRQLVFIIAKDPSCFLTQPSVRVELDDILDFRVPLHRLKRKQPG